MIFIFVLWFHADKYTFWGPVVPLLSSKILRNEKIYLTGGNETISTNAELY